VTLYEVEDYNHASRSIAWINLNEITKVVPFGRLFDGDKKVTENGVGIFFSDRSCVLILPQKWEVLRSKLNISIEAA